MTQRHVVRQVNAILENANTEIASSAPENVDGSRIMREGKAMKKFLHVKIMATAIIAVTGNAAMQQDCRRKGLILANDLKL